MMKRASEEAAGARVSVVMPIHNEEDLLPYSLHPMLDAPVHEFIFVLDRCTDRSKEIVSRFSTRVPGCKTLEKNETRWLNPAAEACDIGAEHASGDWIYLIDADVVADKRVFDPEHWQKGNALRFRYYNYDIRGAPIRWAYEKTVLRITERMGISTGHFATVIALRRDEWMKTRHESPPENIEGLRKNPPLVLRAIMMREHERHFVRIAGTNCLHLRPKTTASEQELQGIARYMLGYRLWRVVVHSIMYFQIRTLVAFVHARSGHYGDLKKWV